MLALKYVGTVPIIFKTYGGLEMAEKNAMLMSFTKAPCVAFKNGPSNAE